MKFKIGDKVSVDIITENDEPLKKNGVIRGYMDGLTYLEVSISWFGMEHTAVMVDKWGRKVPNWKDGPVYSIKYDDDTVGATPEDVVSEVV